MNRIARATSSKRKKKLFVTGIASDSLSSDSLWVSQQDEEEEGDQEGEAETVGEEGAEGELPCHGSCFMIACLVGLDERSGKYIAI